jgi:aspartate 1-decarboxylase
MMLTLLKCKLHRAIVTEADLNYTGSIGIDADLMKAVGILPHEQVDVYNITNGNRITTYAIKTPGGSGNVTINGAAAHLFKKGDKVIICAYAQMTEQEAREHKPTVIILGEKNQVERHG